MERKTKMVVPGKKDITGRRRLGESSSTVESSPKHTHKQTDTQTASVRLHLHPMLQPLPNACVSSVITVSKSKQLQSPTRGFSRDCAACTASLAHRRIEVSERERERERRRTRERGLLQEEEGQDARVHPERIH